MKYFLDTKFHEYNKNIKLFGKQIKQTPTLELISIGIVSETRTRTISVPNEYTNIGVTNSKLTADTNDSCNWNTWEYALPIGEYSITSIKDNQVKLNYFTTYYAICNEFNLKDAWEDLWLRNNVLISIYQGLKLNDIRNSDIGKETLHIDFNDWTEFPKIYYKDLKQLINKYGKSSNQISTEIESFLGTENVETKFGTIEKKYPNERAQFYGYYNTTDWMLFYRLFDTKLLNLPPNINWTCFDLKQDLDMIVQYKANAIDKQSDSVPSKQTFDSVLYEIKSSPNYPTQYNEHKSIDDAVWNKKLYTFLKHQLNEIK